MCEHHANNVQFTFAVSACDSPEIPCRERFKSLVNAMGDHQRRRIGCMFDYFAGRGASTTGIRPVVRSYRNLWCDSRPSPGPWLGKPRPTLGYLLAAYLNHQRRFTLELIPQPISRVRVQNLPRAK